MTSLMHNNTFNGTGGTFTVKRPKDGQGHADAQAFKQDVLKLIAQCGMELGMFPCYVEGAVPRAASFDSSFEAVLSSWHLGVGCRDAGGDMEIGIGATQYLGWQGKIANPDANKASIIQATGRSPEAFMSLYERFASGLQSYLRMELASHGFECATDRPAGLDVLFKDNLAFRQATKESLKNQLATLNAPARDALLRQSASSRAETIDALASTPSDELGRMARDVEILVPVYHHGDTAVLWYSPLAGRFNASSPAAAQYGVDLVALMRDAPAEAGLSAIVRNEATEAWFAEDWRTGYPGKPKGLTLVVSAEEYAGATGKELTIDYRSADAATYNLLRNYDLVVMRVASGNEGGDTCAKLVEHLDTAFIDSRTSVLKDGLKALAAVSDASLSVPKLMEHIDRIEKAIDVVLEAAARPVTLTDVRRHAASLSRPR